MGQVYQATDTKLNRQCRAPVVVCVMLLHMKWRL